MDKVGLRIGIDGRCLSGKLTGIGRYVYELIRQLDKVLPDAKFYVYSPFELSVQLPSDRWVSRIESNRLLARYASGYAWLKFACGRLAATDELDVFWAGRTLLPRLNDSVKTLVTVHDLNHILAPGTMPFVNYCSHRIWFDDDVIRATKVVTNSRGTASKVEKLIGRHVDAVVTPCASPLFHRPSEDDIQKVLANYSIHAPYVLAVGTREPRKNILNLVKAFAILKKNPEFDDMQLVLAGGAGWKTRHVQNEIKRLGSIGLNELGYVSDEHLPGLYAGSEVFVFPSLYEGYGMPVLEARMCGARVVTTDTPELREAGGGATHYLSGTSPEDIVAGIVSVLSTPGDSCISREDRCDWADGASVLGELLAAM